MKIFFGPALDDMVQELRGQGAAMLRVHVLPAIEGQTLRLRTHVTTMCNNQVYEAVVENKVALAEADKDNLAQLVRLKCEEARGQVTEKLSGFELRRGILQE